MRTFPLLIAACGIAVACDSRIQEPAFKPPGRDLDATIVLPNNMYLGTSELTANTEITVKANVEAGEEYEIRVNSYYARQTFELKADLILTSATP